MTIELQFDDGQVKELLNAVVKNMLDAQPAMKTIGRLIVSGIQDNFNKGGAYSSPQSLIGGNKKWKPHSPVTIKIRERRGKTAPHKILLYDNHLRDSITEKAGRDFASVGTIMEYATTHHFGAKKGQFGIHDALFKAHFRNIGGKKVGVKSHRRKVSLPWGDIPARPFMTIHPDTIEDMIDVLAKFITKDK